MKKLYHLFDEEYWITHAEFFTEGEEPDNAVYIENYIFIKGRVNPVTKEVYEAATNEDIENHNQTLSNIMKLNVTSNLSPNDGDLWLQDNTDTGLKIRINGITKTIKLI